MFLGQKTLQTPSGRRKTFERKKRVVMLELGSKLLRADSFSESMTSSACRRIQTSLALEIWEAALKEHFKDTGYDVTDITMANWLRRLVPTESPCRAEVVSHRRYSDVKKYIIDQVGLRLCNDQKRQNCDPNGVKLVDTSLAEHYNEKRDRRNTWK